MQLPQTVASNFNIPKLILKTQWSPIRTTAAVRENNLEGRHRKNGTTHETGVGEFDPDGD